ncbi:DUF6817 domain-containing protein [Actinomadura welshii]|uniref:DUF6817 domain-containing protein n=1 Tax=Actinomadura welshii TaxID=3103817 RepID=UPI0003AD2028|nr:hypothetical protein [Actinomadura madurae]
MTAETAAATELLVAKGARAVKHPGGTLLEHLLRVHALLDGWGARPALGLAGLCHAFYGTDGFATSLGDTGRRGELREVIGAEAEGLVYLYGSCERAGTYPTLNRLDGAFADRFAGTARSISPVQRRDFAELTVANELDVLGAVRDADRAEVTALLDLFSSWRALLTDYANQAVEDAY